MKKAPTNGAGARGSAETIVSFRGHLVHNPTTLNAYVLTDGHGRYTALLSRRTGALTRLGRGARA